MHQVVLFALLGLGTGALTAGLALGLVATYRGSGIVNLAMGAVAMVAGYAFWALNTGFFGLHFGAVVSFALALVVSLIAGALTELLAFRPLREASPLAKLVASLGILLVAQASILLTFGPFPKTEPSILPNRGVSFAGFTTPLVNVLLAGIVVAAAILLIAIYGRTRFGLETKAAFENETSARLLGLSVNRLSMANTLIASLIAGAIGVLAAPVTQLDSQVFPLVVVPALAAAVFASFTSFGIACVAGLLIGAAENVLYYASTLSWFPTDHGVSLPGVQQVLVLVVMVIALFLRGDKLPQRGEHVEKRLPIAPRPERVLRPAVVALLAGGLALIILPFDFRQALINTVIAAALTLSVVVITGYVGQVSVVQLALAGGAGFIVSHLATDAGIGFPAAPIIAALGVTILGVLIAVSALRVRGVQLAVVTLAAAVAIEQFWYASITLGGGQAGAPVPEPHLFGVNLGNDAAFRGLDGKLPSPIIGFVILATTILLAVFVANLRRSTHGQRMLAVRSNERAAAAAGIDVRTVKLGAFALSSFIAGIAGAMYAYNFGSVSATTFGAIAALGVIAFAFVGGITYVSGTLFAALISTEAIVPHAFDKWFGVSGTWALLLGGIGVVFNLVFYPEGAAGAAYQKKLKRQRRGQSGEPAARPRAQLTGALRERLHLSAASHNPAAIDPKELFATSETSRVEPKALEVRDLTVRFGGVTAVNGVSLSIAPGEIVGLIGPNGAGKSTLIDALSGFVRPAAGEIGLGGVDITGVPAHLRVRGGLVRSWQSVDLFDDISVRENMQITAERPRWRSFLELLWPRERPLSSTAAAAVVRFGLHPDLGRLPVELSFSQRRMVSTARSVALNPSVLLLDEPAGGFSDVRRAELADAIAPLARERGMGLLVVDHDMPFVMGLCDRIIVLNFGEKIADGPPHEVRADPAVIAAYLRGDAEERIGEEDEIAAAARARAVRRSRLDESVLLAARDMAVGYYEHPVVRGVELEVRAGEVIALLGANRAGKTTTLLGLAGAIQPLEGEVEWLGETVTKRIPLHRRATQGLAFLTDERSVFRQLTVSENLRVDRHCDPQYVLRLFPELQPLMNRKAGLLSGGEQQMLGLGRALARRPKVLLVDEMSLGLAPIVVARLMEVLRQAADDEGVGIVLVEQHVQEALRISDRVCVVAGGRMTLTGAVDEVVHEVDDAFLADVLGTPA